ncbi:Hematopoietic prostaglandin D synthase [Strongyloides ratti]|uniref:glutathione transferase n=1 Tax=Strongyloides ratti TaxID=34506 RepID=A0A090LMX7_STRRB|nr:Hematopoietic prostaglandin D synthase [Strongyloides ratti]CEF69523.1 Hematopoietic prostaglandin D synthase [Strongyloides ratti]
MPVIPQYTLHYFDLMGKAEVTRMLFNYAGVKFTDNRIKFEDWPALKEKQPFGQLPVLEVDGKVLFQSRAIEKFLARQFGLIGNDDFEAAQVDQYILTIDDVMINFRPAFMEKDEAKKAELMKKAFQEHGVPALKRFEGFLAKNGTGYFVGNGVTLADFALYQFLFYIKKMSSESALDNYPELKKFVQKMYGNEKLKPYLETRSEKLLP